MFSSNTSQVSNAANYIEDVFSTYLYTGNGSTQTINNGIDLAGKGGLVWIKQRDTAGNHLLMTTDGGPTKRLRSNGQPSYVTSAAGTDLASFNSNGFSLGVNNQSDINTSAQTYVSWSLRKQPKFFDVVTWTGNGTNRAIAHNLGSVPGCIIVGATTALGTDWAVYHNGLANTEYLTLNSTAAKATSAAYWNNTTPTSTVFSLGTDATVNYSGGSYIAYIFAHNAGGFGLTGTDNVISCGSFTPDSSGNVDVNLGYEPQWILFKRSATVGSWSIADTMRGMSYSDFNRLYANLSNAEDAQPAAYCVPTATGFKSVTTGVFSANEPHIYIAIRRGPMKVPTSGTSVFSPITTTGDPSNVSVGFPTDWVIHNSRTSSSQHWVTSRLTGGTQYTATNSTAAEASFAPDSDKYDLQNNFTAAPFYGGANQVTYFTRRAPSFFDEVCYTGDGTANGRTFTHNLSVTPQLVIVKKRSSTSDWVVTFNTDHAVLLNSTNADIGYSDASGNYANGALIGTNSTTLTQYSGASGNSACNASGSTYVAYLFASCPGVSKVGSYTGNGTTQTINCGFTGGARFVLIKRTDSTGDWYVWDTARGMVSGTDPSLLLNSTAAEVNANSIYTTTGGFQIVSTAAGINASGGSYIFWAVA